MAFWSKKPDAAAPPPLTCSFCGKTQQQVKQLIAGPSVYICDECVAMCNDIVVDRTEAAREPDPPPSLEALKLSLATRVKGHEALRLLLARTITHAAVATKPPPVVLVVGPAGVGKTALCAALVETCGIPAAHAHVHRMTATGYIGADLENVVQEVVLAAGKHPARAERGLLVLEDLHHLGLRAPSRSLTRDVGGRDVQPQLVRLLERRLLYLPPDPTQRVHPQVPTPPFDPSQLVILLTCRLDAVPDSEPAIREALVELGLLRELLDRIDLVVPAALPGPSDLARLVREKMVPAVAASTGVHLQLSPAEVDALVARAAKPGGLWNVRQALVSQALHGTPT
jgi:hypothetical protein